MNLRCCAGRIVFPRLFRLTTLRENDMIRGTGGPLCTCSRVESSLNHRLGSSAVFARPDRGPARQPEPSRPSASPRTSKYVGGSCSASACHNSNLALGPATGHVDHTRPMRAYEVLFNERPTMQSRFAIVPPRGRALPSATSRRTTNPRIRRRRVLFQDRWRSCAKASRRREKLINHHARRMAPSTIEKKRHE